MSTRHALLVLLFALPVRAQTLQQLCAADDLDAREASARLAWARRCGLEVNVRDPNAVIPTGISGTNGELLEYQESLTGNRYTGESTEHYVNSAYGSKLFSTLGQYTQGRDNRGYYIWTKPRTRSQPEYPTFLGRSRGRLQSVFPRAGGHANDCNLYPGPTQARDQSSAATQFVVAGYCVSSRPPPSAWPVVRLFGWLSSKYGLVRFLVGRWSLMWWH